MHGRMHSSGMPLGGLGTGTVELCRDGRLREWQIFSNWGNWHSLPPVQMLGRGQSPSQDGAFLAVTVGPPGSEPQFRLLEARSRMEMRAFGQVEYLGRFPEAELAFSGLTLPGIVVTLSAFSCFVPHDQQTSSIPAAGFVVTLTNESEQEQGVCALLSVEHPCGTAAECLAEDGSLYLRLCGSDGDLCVAPLDGDPACFIPEEARTPTAYVAELLAALRTGRGVSAHQRRAASAYGAVIASAVLAPGERRSFRFGFCWFFPNTAYEEYAGHIYETRFASALDVARRFRCDFDSIRERVRTWVETIYSGTLPEWFLHLAGNSLSLYARNSLWSRDGRFGLFESFECPSVDNLHVRYPGAVALPLLFPQLESQVLARHATQRRADGRLHEEFQPGGTRPANTRDPYNRDFADIFSCYVLMLSRYTYWTGDTSLLRELWPHVKAVLQYGDQRDDDGDGMPNRSAGNNTYDCSWWDCGDHMSYTATLWAGALLAALRFAGDMADHEFAAWCDECLTRCRHSMQEKLFTGEFYVLGETAGRRIDAVMVDAMSGQWGANLARLGRIVPAECLRSHIRTVMTLNAADTRFGATNSVFRDGRRDVSDPEGRDSRFAEIIWPGATFAFATLAIQEGFVQEGMALIKRTYDNLVENAECSIWNMVDVLDPDTGLPHAWAFTHYLRSGSIWGALEAITGFRYGGVPKEVSLSPVLTPPLEAPFVTPFSFGSFRSDDAALVIRVRDGRLDVSSLEVPVRPGVEELIELRHNGRPVTIAGVTLQRDRARLALGSPLTLLAEDTLSLTWEQCDTAVSAAASAGVS